MAMPMVMRSFSASLLLVLALTNASLASGIYVRGAAAPKSTTPNVPVRLTHHRVNAKITDRVARVTVRQTFRNMRSRVLEGTYLFPLPRGATVSSFAMTMGGKMMRGEILDAEKARAIYLAIVRERRDPGLLEYCGRNIYRARVFPIPADGEIEIELTYEQLLPAHGGAIEFQYPLASERFNRARVEQVQIAVDYDGTVPLKTIYSPSHRIEVARNGDRAARVIYKRARHRPSRALRVYFGRAKQDLGMSMLSHRPAGGDAEGRDGTFLAMLGFDADIKPEKMLPRQMVYVLDTSGSMGGEKLEQAQAALSESVGMLRPQDTFALIGFATTARAFRRVTIPATPDNIAAARRWIRSREAGGGTAMHDALEMALKFAPQGKLPIVVLLTDGRPTIGPRHVKPLLARVSAVNKHSARIFTFGIGADLDVKLLDRLAEATRGKRDYVAPHEEIGAVTKRFFQRIDQPIAQDVVIEASDGIYDIYPRRIGDLFAADQLVVLGRYETSGPATFTLRGTSGGKPFERTYKVTLSDGEEHASIPRIWAQRKVAFLWDQMRLHGGNEELKTEIKRLGEKYSIITRYTSGLVLEDIEIDSSSPLFFDSSRRQRRRSRRVFGIKGVPPGLRTPDGPDGPNSATSPASAADTPVGPFSNSAIGRSAGLRALKEEGRLHNDRDRIIAADKTFAWNTELGWVDTAWDGKGTPTKIAAFSDAYFLLLEDHPEIARYLAVGEWVTFVHKGKTYSVAP